MPPSTPAATSSPALSLSFRPGTAQLRDSITAATRSFSVTVFAAGSVTTGATGNWLLGPGLMAPKYFSTSGLAVAASISPDSTSTALFGP